MSKTAQKTYAPSAAMQRYAERNGKPNAHVVNDQKAGAKSKSNSAPRQTSGKSGCSCG